MNEKSGNGGCNGQETKNPLAFQPKGLKNGLKPLCNYFTNNIFLTSENPFASSL